ncbi:uncharacterized protein LOC124925085 [Impatiens glandulifera]|uniref:uncharacterized protein LOC124925085 n=1 Tax=Impatiens glandulifera TaxID=253017 RepID=UPI001FB0B66B|nr:uncharacterized protein LOC124925085 [Impatiens glandulifera]
MAGTCIYPRPWPILHRDSKSGIHGGFRCCSRNNVSKREKDPPTPFLLRIAVSGVTELLRIISPSDKLKKENAMTGNEVSVSSIDDVVLILKSDYANAYFVTGNFTSTIYAEDCLFEDPTIKFYGSELYSRNLKLLVPFFQHPSIELKTINKLNSSLGANSVLANWKLRTYLKLPWKPLISIDGSTVYDLDEELKIVRHAESWEISAFEAISQIFTPSPGK